MLPDTNSVPAYLLSGAYSMPDPSVFIAGIGGTRGPHISVKNGAFSLVYSSESIKQPTDHQGQVLFDPQRGALYLDMVVVDAARGLAKTWYEKGFQEGESAPPDCWSNDAIYPDRSVAEPYHDTCLGCPMNMFGSSHNVTTGKPGKACSDRKRLAVLYLYDLQGPLLEFSVSPSNLKGWAAYATDVGGRVPGGVTSIVTRVYIDRTRTGGVTFEAAPNPAYRSPQSPMGAGTWYIPEAMLPLLAAARASEECKKAIGADTQPMLLVNSPERTPAIAADPRAAQASEPQRQISGTPEAPKRPRRTKVEIEAARRAEQAALVAAQQGQPLPGAQVGAPTAPQAPLQAQFPSVAPQAPLQAQFPSAAPQGQPGAVAAPMAAQGYGSAGIRAPESDPFAVQPASTQPPAAGYAAPAQPAQAQSPTTQPPTAPPAAAPLASDPFELPASLRRPQPGAAPTANHAFGVATGLPPTDPAMDAMLSNVIGRAA